jgi:hypothetical protein
MNHVKPIGCRVMNKNLEKGVDFSIEWRFVFGKLTWRGLK